MHFTWIKIWTVLSLNALLHWKTFNRSMSSETYSYRTAWVTYSLYIAYPYYVLSCLVSELFLQRFGLEDQHQIIPSFVTEPDRQIMLGSTARPRIITDAVAEYCMYVIHSVQACHVEATLVPSLYRHCWLSVQLSQQRNHGETPPRAVSSRNVHTQTATTSCLHC